MKYFLTAVVLSIGFVGAAAKAENAASQIYALSSQDASVNVLCQKIKQGAINSANRSGVVVHRTGEVARVTSQGELPIAFLKPEQITELQGLLDQIQGPIADQNPKSAHCHNTSITTYSGFKSDGAEIEAVRLAGCHTYISQGAAPIRAFLDQYK